jgi:hypothetical protein
MFTLVLVTAPDHSSKVPNIGKKRENPIEEPAAVAAATVLPLLPTSPMMNNGLRSCEHQYYSRRPIFPIYLVYPLYP